MNNRGDIIVEEVKCEEMIDNNIIKETDHGNASEQIQIVEMNHTDTDTDTDMQDVLEFAVEAGRNLLRNGAEIFRVEETITHICNHYGVKDLNLYVLSNGIFVTAEKEGREIFAKIKHIPLSGTHLGIVDGVNGLSRRICAGEVSLEEARAELEVISALPPKKAYFRIISGAIGSGAFTYLINATILDCFRTFLISLVLNTFLELGYKTKLSKMLINTVGGALVTILAILLCREGGMIVNSSLDRVIIGSIFCLIPGVAFVNSLRDIANSDILSGIVKMIDAILGFLYIAIGVGAILSIYNSLFGGITL